jgi:hypothetical protein
MKRTQVAMSAARSEPLNPTELASNAPHFSYGLTPTPSEAKTVMAKAEVSPALNTTTAQSAAFFSSSVGQQSWNFQQIDRRSRYRDNRNSPPAPKVLTSFAVQRAAQNVRVVDSDGSIYEGMVEEPAPSQIDLALSRGLSAQGGAPSEKPELVPTRLNQQPVAAPASAEVGQALTLAQGPATTQMAVQPGQNASANTSPISFRATGTNRTLNQLVDFSGVIQQGMIKGKASVGQNNELRIEAQQVGP